MKIQKAYEIYDAKISFMSLVDKAANKREFLITKAKDDDANFQYFGRIIKADPATHYVTGVAYEPDIEDAHGNFMSEGEIQKAAYWFAKNGDKVDIQHSFEAIDGATVVENWVTKSDETIGDETIKKGTWLVTMEVTDDDLWDKIEKGEITGFSMGGVGKYSTKDVEVSKMESNSGNKSIFKKFAESLGFQVVEKGAVADQYNEKKKYSGFWNAINSLQNVLAGPEHWNYITQCYEYNFETDEEKIREALTDFCNIVQDLLAEQSITKALAETEPDKPIEKAGKKMSSANKKKLDSICEALTAFGKEFDDNEDEEEEVMKKEDMEAIQKMIEESVEKAVSKKGSGETKKTENTEVSNDSIQKMIDAAITKAVEKFEPKQPEPTQEEQLSKSIETAVAKALEPLLKARGVSSNLNDDGIQKSAEDHYLKGIL